MGDGETNGNWKRELERIENKLAGWDRQEVAGKLNFEAAYKSLRAITGIVLVHLEETKDELREARTEWA